MKKKKKKKNNQNPNRLTRPGRNITSDYERRALFDGEQMGGTSPRERSRLLLIQNKCILVWLTPSSSFRIRYLTHWGDVRRFSCSVVITFCNCEKRVQFYRTLTAPGRGDALIGFYANNDDIGLTIHCDDAATSSFGNR